MKPIEIRIGKSKPESKQESKPKIPELEPIVRRLSDYVANIHRNTFKRKFELFIPLAKMDGTPKERSRIIANATQTTGSLLLANGIGEKVEILPNKPYFFNKCYKLDREPMNCIEFKHMSLIFVQYIPVLCDELKKKRIPFFHKFQVNGASIFAEKESLKKYTQEEGECKQIDTTTILRILENLKEDEKWLKDEIVEISHRGVIKMITFIISTINNRVVIIESRSDTNKDIFTYFVDGKVRERERVIDPDSETRLTEVMRILDEIRISKEGHMSLDRTSESDHRISIKSDASEKKPKKKEAKKLVNDESKN